MEPRRFNFKGRARSFGFALVGLKYVLSTQHNFWIHIAISALVVTLGFILHVSVNDWRWLIAAMGLVLVAETLNTAIEKTCDAYSVEINLNVEKAKNIAAGAVLIAATAAAFIGILTFWPYIFKF